MTVVRKAQFLGKSAIRKGLYYHASLFGAHSRRFRRERAYILSYHSIGAENDPCFRSIGASISVARKAFERQMAYLAERYRVVSLDALLAFLSTGRAEYDDDRPLLALTFDDGYRDNYERAYPVLRRHGLTATFFLTVDCIGGDHALWQMRLRDTILNGGTGTLVIDGLAPLGLKTLKEKYQALKIIGRHLIAVPREVREETIRCLQEQTGVGNEKMLAAAMLNWEQVREMQRGGMTFGSHTLSHPSLPYIPEEEAWQEISRSKAIIEQQLDAPVLHFCYPNPTGKKNFNQRLRSMLRKAGYESAVTSQNGYVVPGDDTLEMRRKGINRGHGTLPDFYFQIEEEAIRDTWKQRRLG